MIENFKPTKGYIASIHIDTPWEQFEKTHIICSMLGEDSSYIRECDPYYVIKYKG